MQEIWKDIPNYEGYYQISSLGRVKSLERHIVYKDGRERTYPSVIISNRVGTNGMELCTLTKNNRKKNIEIHRMVSIVFIGDCPKGYDICHIDGNCLNNNINNLKYDTRSENRIDNYRYGGKASTGKLNIKQVLEIRHKYKHEKYTYKQLSDIYDIGITQIGRIIRREAYTWLNDNGEIEKSLTEIKSC